MKDCGEDASGGARVDALLDRVSLALIPISLFVTSPVDLDN